MKDDFVNDAPVTPDAPETDTANAAPVTDTAPSAPKAVELDDNALVTIKVDGQVQTVKFGEAKRHIQLGSYNDRRAQQNAAERKQIEAERAEAAKLKEAYEQRIGEVRGILSDEQKLMALYMAAQARRQTPEQPTPLTAADLPTIKKQLEAEQEELFRARVSEWEQTQHRRQMESTVADITTTTISKFPALRAIPGVEHAIYNRVVATAPEGGFASLDEAREAIHAVAESAALAVKKAHEDQLKADVLEKDKAVRFGLEPRGGKGVMPEPMSLKTRSDRENAVIEALERLS